MISRILCRLAVLMLLFPGLISCRAQTASSNNLQPPKKSSPGIFGLGFSRDGRTLVTGNFNGTVKLETETGVRLAICDSLSLATVVLLNALGAPL